MSRANNESSVTWTTGLPHNKQNWVKYLWWGARVGHIALMSWWCVCHISFNASHSCVLTEQCTNVYPNYAVPGTRATSPPLSTLSCFIYPDVWTTFPRSVDHWQKFRGLIYLLDCIKDNNSLPKGQCLSVKSVIALLGWLQIINNNVSIWWLHVWAYDHNVQQNMYRNNHSTSPPSLKEGWQQFNGK